MSSVVACYKWVVDEADIRIADDLSVDTAWAKWKLSDYDKNAIEAASQAGRILDAKTYGLTFGGPKARRSFKDALSRGLDEGVFVECDEGVEPDGALTARALAAAIKRLDDVKVVFCAEGSSDVYARQTASRVAAMLDWPAVVSAQSIEFADGAAIVVRKLDGCLQKVRVGLPAVVGVLPEMNEPSAPGLRAVLQAGKKPVEEHSLGSLTDRFGPSVVAGEMKGYVAKRKAVVFKEGAPEERVAALVGALRKEGVL